MSGKGNFCFGGENLQPTRLALLRRKDKRGFLKIEFPGDLLHFDVIEPLGIGQHSQLIAAEVSPGENVTDEEVIIQSRSIEKVRTIC